MFGLLTGSIGTIQTFESDIWNKFQLDETELFAISKLAIVSSRNKHQEYNILC